MPSPPCHILLPSQVQEARIGWHRAQTQGMPDVQHVYISVTLLRHNLREDERLAGLALISSLRKRLCNLPWELAADGTPRVRKSNLASAW